MPGITWRPPFVPSRWTLCRSRSAPCLGLAEAYAVIGDTAAAAAALRGWESADPVLQPRVEAARRRLAELVERRG